MRWRHRRDWQEWVIPLAIALNVGVLILIGLRVIG